MLALHCVHNSKSWSRINLAGLSHHDAALLVLLQKTRNIPILKGKYMHPNTFECLVSASVHLIGQSKSESVGATDPYFSLESELAINVSLSITK